MLVTAPETWLRIVLYEMRDADFDHYQRSLDYMKSSVRYFAAALERQPGFQVAHWGVDLDDGQIAAVTRWSSLQAIEGAESELRRLQEDAQVHAGIRRMHVQNNRLFALPGPTSNGTEAPPGGEAVIPESWLRVVTYRVDLTDQRAETYMTCSIQDCLRVLEKQPGFHLGYWGRDCGGGAMSAVTYWLSREAIATAGPTLQGLQMEAASNGVRPMDVRNFHLFAVTPAPRTG